jgi:cytoskeletal protein CcmA (bactofilin family)
MQTGTFENGGTAPAPNSAIAAVAARKAASGDARELEKRDMPVKRDLPEKRDTSVIGVDIIITGNIEGADLNIEGKVIGDVRCATLILGESSMVNGRIYAARVKVSGTVEGAIETKDLAVEASARVIGDISYERLRVVNGAAVEGNVTRRTPTEIPEDIGRSRFQLVEQDQEREPEQAPESINDMMSE